MFARKRLEGKRLHARTISCYWPWSLVWILTFLLVVHMETITRISLRYVWIHPLWKEIHCNRQDNFSWEATKRTRSVAVCHHPFQQAGHQPGVFVNPICLRSFDQGNKKDFPPEGLSSREKSSTVLSRLSSPVLCSQTEKLVLTYENIFFFLLPAFDSSFHQNLYAPSGLTHHAVARAHGIFDIPENLQTQASRLTGCVYSGNLMDQSIDVNLKLLIHHLSIRLIPTMVSTYVFCVMFSRKLLSS